MTAKRPKFDRRPTPWWGPLALLAATGVTASCAASAYQAGDGLQLVVASVVTAFNATLTGAAYMMRAEDRRARQG